MAMLAPQSGAAQSGAAQSGAAQSGAAQSGAAQSGAAPPARTPVALALLRVPLDSSRAPGDPWLGRDKAKHFGAAVVVQSMGYALMRRHGAARAPAQWRAAALTTALGVGKELWDGQGHGDASWRDVTWDGIGLVVGATLVHSLDRGH